MLARKFYLTKIAQIELKDEVKIKFGVNFGVRVFLNFGSEYKALLSMDFEILFVRFSFDSVKDIINLFYSI